MPGKRLAWTVDSKKAAGEPAMVQSPLATIVPEPAWESSQVTASCGVMLDGNGSALTTAPLGPFPVSSANVASSPFFPSSAGFSAHPEGKATVTPRALLRTFAPPLGGGTTQSLAARAAGSGVMAGVTTA